MRRAFMVPVLLAVLLAAFPATESHAAPRCFPEVAATIPDCIDGRIRSFWEQQGGLPVFGYPLGPQREEQTELGTRVVQLFERARLELHPEHAAPYDVLIGRMGADALIRQNRDWNTFPKGDPNAPHYFAETGHAIAPQFWGYWSRYGLEFDGRPGKSFAESLALFGMPLSEASMEVNPTDGKQYLTQHFERARFEHHPENAGTAYEVQLGLLGRELGGASNISTGAAMSPDLPPGGFIKPVGDQLTRHGQPVRIKGINYYPQWRPWAPMWRDWDGPQVERELRLARDQLGINAVRIMVPYGVPGTRTEKGRVSDDVLGRLREMVQIAGSLDMRVIVTLFDFYPDFPRPGGEEEQENFNYLRTIVGNFVGDDRILAWDLHNEPDHYGVWEDGDPGKALTWLGRMADEVHRIAPNHMVTVGMGQYNNLWLPGPDGRRVIDYSDVVSMHVYDAGAAARQLEELRRHTSKPILVEEFGWPTGPRCLRNYNEEVQAGLYRDILAAARIHAAGVFAWTLRDYDSGPTGRWDHFEEHFGLYRPDGSLKPAAEHLRAYPGGPLPSATVTNLSLTSTNPRLPSGPEDSLLIPGSGHYVKAAFRRAWELLGGQGSFGLPLTEAYVRPDDRRVVQYFEGAVLELYPEAAKEPGFSLLPETEQIKRLIVPVPIGSTYTAGRAPSAESVGELLRGFYNSVHGSWRLGAPLSGVMTEELNGVPVQVQYFQKGRLEWNAAAGRVEVGRLGTWALEMQCRSPQ